MNVGELKAKLTEYDDDYIVCFDEGDFIFPTEIANVQEGTRMVGIATAYPVEEKIIIFTALFAGL